VQIAPQFDTQADTDHTFQIKLSNPFDIPLQIRVEEGFGWDQWVTIDSHQIELAPNSVEWVSGSFHPRRNQLSLEMLRPTPVKFYVSAEISEGNIIEIPILLNLKPLPKNYLIQSEKKVLVDADLSEWDLSKEFTMMADTKFRFGVSYNDSHIFLAAEVTDDTLVIDTSTSISRQDNIGLFLNFTPTIKSAQSPAQSYNLRLTPQQADFQSLVQSPKNIPADWQYSCQATSGGYNFEVAIPLKYLNDAQGGNWKSLRLNWNIDDLDDPNDWQKTERNSLYPAWGSDREILGSGIYFKKDH
jgi:hypothetical protein